jgi:hypothetical protein
MQRWRRWSGCRRKRRGCRYGGEDNWLASFRDELKRDTTAICRIDAKKVSLDIAARKADVKLARLHIGRRLLLIAELGKIGTSEEAWCQTSGGGKRARRCDAASNRRGR